METTNEKLTMVDTLHKCLMCNEAAHEIEKGTYMCSDDNCGFVWKVETCDE